MPALTFDIIRPLLWFSLSSGSGQSLHRRRNLTHVRLGYSTLYKFAGVMPGKFLNAANRVSNGARIRAAVRDNHNLPNPQQRHAAILGIIETLLDVSEGR